MTRRMLTYALAVAALTLFARQAPAQWFEIGQPGFAGDVNNWPDGEAPQFAIDGFGQKYLNFGKENTGVAVSPASSALPAGITVWTANDEVPRDPASFAIYGTNSPAAGSAGDLIGGLVWLDGGPLSLPADRTEGDDTPLGSFSSTAALDIATGYETYVVVFPTLTDGGLANSMQIAEVQLQDAAGAPIFTPNDAIVGGQIWVPEPSSLIVAMIGLICATCGRRRD